MDPAQKRCSTCQLMRPLTDFNKRATAPDGLQWRCRSCSRDWYLAHQEEHKANVRERNTRVRREYAARLVDYFLDHPCVDCGDDDVRVLEFDHEDPSQKTGDVTTMANCAASWSRIEAEIAKCSVRCANCHRRRTALMFGYWRHTVHEQRQADRHADAVARLTALQLGAG